MSAAETPTARPEFSVGPILALVLVSVVAFAGLAVLGAYAPELRDGNDGRAHALSKSAIGYAGLTVFARTMGAPVVVSRTRPLRASTAAVVLTPDLTVDPDELRAYPKGRLTLIVLPKWSVAGDPLRRSFVRKITVAPGPKAFQELLKSYAPATLIDHRKGVTRPVLQGGEARPLQLGPIDRLQTLSGDGWIPVLADEQGRTVLAASRKTPSIWVLADPDILNNQGLASRDTAGAAWAIIDAARGGEQPVVFDVTLNGLERSKGLLRTMLSPPWVAATLCGVAAALLMGFHALARFGQPVRPGRAFALGARALVDNSAGLFRMARKEHELAPAYAALVTHEIARASGGHDAAWLDELARRRGAASPGELAEAAGKARTRDDLLAIARRLYQWQSEMTRERR